MYLEELQRLGLTEPESKIYLYLLQYGPNLAGTIAKGTHVNRTTVYDALERLKIKNFITHTVSANRKLFKALPSENIVKYFDQKQLEAQKLSAKLSSISVEEDESFEVFEGKKGIKSILQEILSYRSYVAFGSSGKFMEVMKFDFELFQKRKKELKISSRILQSTKNKEVSKIAYAKIKYLPQEHDSPVTTIVYGDISVIIIWSVIPHAMRIKSKAVAQQYQDQFEILWKLAK